MKTNPSGFVPDFQFPELCIFFLLGCYWALEGGLIRPLGIGCPRSPLRRRSKYVFQDLHDMQDRSVSTQITNIIRSCIPQQLKGYFSGRSIRYGAMTELSWDPAVAYVEAVTLGGWATPSNSDFYVWIYLVAIIPPVLCLAGYPDCRVIPQLPQSGLLFNLPEQDHRLTPDQWQSFVSHLYVNQLP